MSDFNLAMLDDAGAATKQSELASEKLSFGKWTFTGAVYQQWMEGEGAFAELTYDQYKAAKTAGEKGLKVSYTININIQELNPDLTFTYDRKLDVGGADWNKTFVPSLAQVFGKSAVYGANGKVDEAQFNTTLKRLHEAYVCVSDVPQQPRKGDKHINATTGEPYRTTKLVAVYADKASCVAARDARFAKKDATPSNGHVSDAWTTLKGDGDFAQALKEAAGAVKPPPKKIAAITDTAKEWGLSADEVDANMNELKVLAGI